METITCRFCWALSWQDVFGRGGSLFKFLKIVPMTHATSTNIITALRHIFSYFGLPEQLVTDNGTQFTSDEFQKYLRQNDIFHTVTAPGTSCVNRLRGSTRF